MSPTSLILFVPSGTIKATTMFCHKVLSLAEAWASPHDSPFSFSSAIAVCRHFIFGRPRFLFPGGAHLSVTLGMLSLGFLRTCPGQLSRPHLISRTALLQPIFLLRFLVKLLADYWTLYSLDDPVINDCLIGLIRLLDNCRFHTYK